MMAGCGTAVKAECGDGGWWGERGTSCFLYGGQGRLL